jgi:hypothetical protein
MLRLRTHVLICLGFFLALLAFGLGGALLADAGIVAPSPAWRWPVLAVLFVLVLGFAFSAVPVMVLLVTGAQGRIGGPLSALATPRWQRGIVFTGWGLMALGTAIAVPAAVLLGGFDDFGLAADHGEAQGTLVARPGMSVEEIRRGSTLKVNDGGLAEPPVLAEGIVFDFVIAGTAIRLPRCRYYYMSTDMHDRQRVEDINIGVSTDTLPRAQLARDAAALRARLAADGWLAGHEEYRDEQDRQLHGGRAHGPEGDLWLKDGVVLHFEDKRMDEAVPGEDAASAGEWIQVVQLSLQADYPYLDRYVFQPAGRLEDPRP